MWKHVLRRASIMFIVVTLGQHCRMAVACDGKSTIYTEAEGKALEEFRGIANDTIQEDYQFRKSFLIHWLRAQKFDVKKAKAMLVKSLQWRRDNGIDNILKDKELIGLEKEIPFSLDETDRDGRPIFSYHISNLNYRKLVLAGKLELIKRYQIYQYEKASRRARENALKHRRGTNDWIILGDMNGYNKREHFCLSCFPLYVDLISIFSNNYPNMVQNIIYVNAPRSLGPILNLFRPITPPEILDLVHVMGHNKNEWKPYLLKLITEKELPPGFA